MLTQDEADKLYAQYWENYNHDNKTIFDKIAFHQAELNNLSEATKNGLKVPGLYQLTIFHRDVIAELESNLQFRDIQRQVIEDEFELLNRIRMFFEKQEEKKNA